MPFLGFVRFAAGRRREERLLRAYLALAGALLCPGCSHAIVPQTHAATVSPATSETTEPPTHKQVRATGTVVAVRSYTVQTPQITGQGGQLTLTALAPNGTNVAVGDILAEFDHTAQIDAAIQAKTKYED